jgi:hypothetical protein
MLFGARTVARKW